MICPVCHAENRAKAKFCDECGARLSAAVTLPEIDVAGLTTPVNGQPDLDECRFDPADADSPRDDEPAPAPAQTPDAAPDAQDPAGCPCAGATGVLPASAPEGGERGFAECDPQARDCMLESELAGDAAQNQSARSAAGETAVIAQAGDAAKAQRDPEPEPDGLDVPVSIWRTGTTMEMPRVESDAPAAASTGYRAPENPKKKRNLTKIVSGIIILALLIAGTAAAVTYNMELWGGIKIPDVDGMTKVDATYALEEKGFTVRAMDVRSDDTEGLVLMSDPEAGSRAEAGSEVVIHVAVARTIPDVLGKPQNDALAALAKAGYDQVTVKTEKSNETEGSVIAINPETGKKAKAGTSITLTVAVPYTIPDVVGTNFDDAKAALEQEGYVVEASRVYTENTPENTVISTDPVAGTKLKSGETVTVYVAKSRASELVEATRGYLYPGAQVQVGSTNYEIQSLDSVEFAGNNTTKFSMTAKPFTWFLGETIYLSARTVTGSIVWADDNSIISVS